MVPAQDCQRRGVQGRINSGHTLPSTTILTVTIVGGDSACLFVCWGFSITVPVSTFTGGCCTSAVIVISVYKDCNRPTVIIKHVNSRCIHIRLTTDVKWQVVIIFNEKLQLGTQYFNEMKLFVLLPKAHIKTIIGCC